MRIGFNPEIVAARMDLFHDVELAEGVADVRRIVFTTLKHAHHGTIHLEIVPL
jgi:hypothetical protein